MNLMRYQHADRLVARAIVETQNCNYKAAWILLEEAHIFAQPDPSTHFYVHWQMLIVAFKSKDKREIWGQVIRLVLSAPSSVFRSYPIGNTGRSSVGLFTQMKLSQRNQIKLEKLDKQEMKRIEEGKRMLTVEYTPPRLQIKNHKIRR